MIGFAMCGSYCTHAASLRELEELRADGYDILPIVSENVYSTDTRFGTAEALRKRLFEICGREAIHDIVSAEPLGPKIELEALLICPCTGNTLAKMASGITDTAVTMAAKAHLRSDRPLVIALASNDAMSQNLANLATMLQRKSVYFVPLCQDDPEGKPHSLVADFARIPEALDAMMMRRQLRPLFV
jgi:dipicolinate synthase subunit B